MNPFDDQDADFLVLVNAENQHSLWPVFADIPSGWVKVAGPMKQKIAMEWVASHWTDMRPASLIKEMDSQSSF